MKFGLAAYLTLLPLGAHSFHLPSSTSSSTTTQLYQFGTLGFDTANLYSRSEEEQIKTRNEVMSYLSEIAQSSPPVVLRKHLGSTVVISGFNPEEPASQEILAFLNNEFSPHLSDTFKKIIAHVDDVKVGKKRLIGRNARYTGLLDKLDFTQSESEGALPTVAQLEGVSSWVAHVAGGDNLSKLEDIVAVAEGAESVKNVAILVSGAQNVKGEELKKVEEMMKSKATTFEYTLVVVPEWNDEPEANCAFGIVNVTDVVDDAPFGEDVGSFSREESLRIITEALAIDKAAGKCVVATAAPDAKSLETYLVQGMREIGFDRLQEVEHMVTRGVKGYNEMLATEKEGVAWEKAPEPTDEELALEAASKEERMVLMRQKRQDTEKEEELKALATEWAKREFLRKSLKRRIPIGEEEFIEIVWDRAMFEADLKYRTMMGLAVNESEERAQFKEDQKARKAAAYKKEQDRWNNLSTEDIEPPEQTTAVTFGGM
uniref:Uncharacterized protein n=1 Tax=Skeletonema marinoi TaxID=267567 RepID=A0A7S1YNU7_9STRA|mmetsp:Transcript_431/g.656  ORF Transcript_431/g.656 Transcript_431/m.656 type:complete len:487 (+) Transcript_431:119-1579(+)